MILLLNTAPQMLVVMTTVQMLNIQKYRGVFLVTVYATVLNTFWDLMEK